MKNEDITDPVFLEAVQAIDSGNIPALQALISAHPRLIKEPLSTPDKKGYFKNPYLLWFVADNPIRHERLPDNIVEVTRVLIDAYQKEQLPNWSHILNYAMGLVATGRIPRACKVQLPLMELLAQAGAAIGSGMGAIAHGNLEVAHWLIEKGSEVTLPVAVGLDRDADVQRLLPTASRKELQEALMVAAFYGKANALSLLLQQGADPNAYIDNKSGFHSHASPLHQAVWSGNIEAVKILVEAGANLHLTDRAYGGTPLGWAQYMQESNDPGDLNKEKIKAIEMYLSSKLNT